MTPANKERERGERLHRCRCGATWTGLSRAHCAACHVTFSAVTNFDAHRVKGECKDPAEMGLRCLPESRYGNAPIWAKPGEPWFKD